MSENAPTLTCPECSFEHAVCSVYQKTENGYIYIEWCNFGECEWKKVRPASEEEWRAIERAV